MTRQERASGGLLASQHLRRFGHKSIFILEFVVAPPSPPFGLTFQKGLACSVYISLLRMHLFTHERKQKDNIIHMAHTGAGVAVP